MATRLGLLFCFQAQLRPQIPNFRPHVRWLNSLQYVTMTCRGRAALLSHDLPPDKGSAANPKEPRKQKRPGCNRVLCVSWGASARPNLKILPAQVITRMLTGLVAYCPGSIFFCENPSNQGLSPGMSTRSTVSSRPPLLAPKGHPLAHARGTGGAQAIR